MEQYIMEGLGIILTGLMSYIVWLLKEQKRDRSAQEQGIMLLLRVQLIDAHDKYMKEGSIPSFAYQNYQDMYKAYHELGGNSMVDKMNEEVKQLRLKQKEGEE